MGLLVSSNFSELYCCRALLSLDFPLSLPPWSGLRPEVQCQSRPTWAIVPLPLHRLSHRLETMGRQCFLVFSGESSSLQFQGFLGGAKWISPIHSMGQRQQLISRNAKLNEAFLKLRSHHGFLDGFSSFQSGSNSSFTRNVESSKGHLGSLPYGGYFVWNNS